MSPVLIATVLAEEPVPLGIGKETVQARDPRLAFALAVLVGVAVFALLWKIRKTFGMRE